MTAMSDQTPPGQSDTVYRCADCEAPPSVECRCTPEDCPDCEGVGSHYADCTTFGPGCACSGPRVTCRTCDGEGVR